jgi:hypothetical protein
MSLDGFRFFVDLVLFSTHHCQLFLSFIFPRSSFLNFFRLSNCIFLFPSVFKRFRDNFPLQGKHVFAFGHPDASERLNLLALSLSQKFRN